MRLTCTGMYVGWIYTRPYSTRICNSFALVSKKVTLPGESPLIALAFNGGFKCNNSDSPRAEPAVRHKSSRSAITCRHLSRVRSGAGGVPNNRSSKSQSNIYQGARIRDPCRFKAAAQS